jgi:ribosomal protein S18 acetylase RimI-like enzyme
MVGQFKQLLSLNHRGLDGRPFVRAVQASSGYREAICAVILCDVWDCPIMLIERSLTPADLDLICRHRKEMFRASGRPDRSEQTLNTMTTSFLAWLEPRLVSGSYFGFVIEDDLMPIAGIGLMVIDWPPHPSHPIQDKRGYILNVFVEASHRNRGVGTTLMALAETELKKRGVSFAVLHATAMGQRLYNALGWKATAEMAKSL